MRTFCLSLVLSGIAGTPLAVAEETAPARPTISRSEEQLLLNMRKQLGPVVQGEWDPTLQEPPGDRPSPLAGQPAQKPKPQNESSREFRQGLRRAASVRQPNQVGVPLYSAPQPAFTQLHGGPVPAGSTWQTLFGAAAQLDQAAGQLERRELWDQADRLREVAGKLRDESRKRQASVPMPSPLDPTYSPVGTNPAPTPHNPSGFRQVEVPDWLGLLEVAHHVDAAAAPLEQQGLWDLAKQIRAQSALLRTDARKLSTQ